MNEFDFRKRSKNGGESGKHEPVRFLAAAAVAALVTRSGAPGMRAIQGREGAGRQGAGPASAACSCAGGAVIAACAHMAGAHAAPGSSVHATARRPPEDSWVGSSPDPAGQSNQN